MIEIFNFCYVLFEKITVELILLYKDKDHK
jgi:hypothetical protein